MKKNIVVMFGGPSVEHDVSVITGMQVLRHFDHEKYKTFPIYWAKDGRFLTIENHLDHATLLKNISYHGTEVAFKPHYLVQRGGLFQSKTEKIDCIIPCFHGSLGEDGAAQGLFESLDLPYTGSSVSASAIGMDKVIFKAVMAQHKIATLPYQVIRSGETKITVDFAFPVIVKPAHLGSSIGVKKCQSLADVKDGLSVIFKLDNTALIEPFLEKMTEINCSVLGTASDNQASVCEQPISADEILSFEDKYMHGDKGKSKGMASLDRRIPAPISAEASKHIRQLAQAIFSACGCSGVARIDFMIDNTNNKTYVTEINTIPGSLAFYLWEASGVSFKELLDKLIQIAEQEHAQKKKLVRTYDSSILKKMM